MSAKPQAKESWENTKTSSAERTKKVRAEQAKHIEEANLKIEEANKTPFR